MQDKSDSKVSSEIAEADSIGDPDLKVILLGDRFLITI